MALDTFLCPECGVKLRRSAQLSPGSRVKCPRCSNEFAVPPLDAGEPDEPARPGRADPGFATQPGGVGERGEPARPGEVTDRPAPKSEVPTRRDLDEDYDADYPHARVRSTGEVSNDYKVDLGQWFNLGFKHWGSFLGPFIGFALILLFLAIPLTILFPIAPFVLPHLAVGPYIVALKLLRGRPWSFGDFFGGFSWYGSLLGWALITGGANLLLAIPYLAGYINFFVQLDNANRSGGGGAVPEAILLLGAGILFTLVTTSYLQVRWFYSLYLIVDRDHGAVESLRGSWRMTNGKFWITFGIWFLLQMLNSAGVSLCYVGLLFSLPLTVLISTAGYLLITGSLAPEPEGRRPPPSRRDDY